MGEWIYRSFEFTPEERTFSIYWIGGWMFPIFGLDGLEEIKFLALDQVVADVQGGISHTPP
jgi:hypothetical protein